jgi:enamine deaminase RidA (YjgF/YER057c/UK114 family)
MKRIVNPSELAKPVGFSHGILTRGGSLLFLAGQTGSDREGRIVAPGDLVKQYDLALGNLEHVVAEAGGKIQDIVKLNIFVRDRDDYIAKRKQLGAVHRARFGSYYPTMALFEIVELFQQDALVELEGIAVIGVDAS